MRIGRVLTLCAVVGWAPLAAPSGSYAQAAPPAATGNAAPRPSRQEQLDIQALVDAVDKAAAGVSIAADVPVSWISNDFLNGQEGVTFVPFTIRIDPASLASRSAMVYVRVVRSGGEPGPDQATRPGTSTAAQGTSNASPARRTYAWENVYAVPVPADGVLSRAMQVPAGAYDVYVAAKARGDETAPSPATGVVRRALTVPDFAAPGLTTSTIVLAKAVEVAEVLASGASEDPYVFGGTRIVRAENEIFAKAGSLSPIFWIYGATPNASGKPDIQVEYSFYQKRPEGEKYFNKTPPLLLGPGTLPPDFNLTAGSQLTASQAVPLASFPPGEYRLEIKVTDKATGAAVTRNTTFTVAA